MYYIVFNRKQCLQQVTAHEFLTEDELDQFVENSSGLAVYATSDNLADAYSAFEEEVDSAMLRLKLAAESADRQRKELPVTMADVYDAPIECGTKVIFSTVYNNSPVIRVGKVKDLHTDKDGHAVADIADDWGVVFKDVQSASICKK